MVSAILFDLYETLVTEREANPTRASSLGERLGLNGTDFHKAWRPQRARVVRGQVSFADALLEIGMMLGRTLDISLVRELSEERRLEKAALLQNIGSEALKSLRQLHDCGCKLAVISNCFAEDVAAWPRCHAAEYFDASVFSFEVGTAKPELEIYREAMRRLNVESSNTMFIGDGGDNELLGAERAGVRAAQAAWFRGELMGLPPYIPRLASWASVFELATAG